VTLRLLTNFTNSPDHLDLPNGERAAILRAETWQDLLPKLKDADAVVIDCRGFLIYAILGYFLALPWRRRPIVAVDLVLRLPQSLRHRATAVVKRMLLSRVDHFIHYFKDISGYQSFGVRADKSSYVPFKVNIFGTQPPEFGVGEYIFTMGVSLRDYDTFIRAVAALPFPAAIPEFSFQHFEGRGKTFRWTKENVPPNLTLLRDTGDKVDLLRNMAAARIVVIPISKISLCASGISTYLDAMYLGKCVVVTEGPGASDLLTDQAILVPAEDPAALSEAIRRAWSDDALRHKTAEAGRRYAVGLGGEAEMLARIHFRAIEATGLAAL
jgi:glycosyltransferase involved in cell wall biosynthesis